MGDGGTKELVSAIVLGMAAACTLLFWPVKGEAAPFNFRKLADANTPIPGGVGTFIAFGGPSLDRGNVAFCGRGSGLQEGCYTEICGDLGLVADLNTPFPSGGTGNFTLIGGGSSLDGDLVVFTGSGFVPKEGFPLLQRLHGLYTATADGGALGIVVLRICESYLEASRCEG